MAEISLAVRGDVSAPLDNKSHLAECSLEEIFHNRCTTVHIAHLNCVLNQLNEKHLCNNYSGMNFMFMNKLHLIIAHLQASFIVYPNNNTKPAQYSKCLLICSIL